MRVAMSGCGMMCCAAVFMPGSVAVREVHSHPISDLSRVIARSVCDEAIQIYFSRYNNWIASLRSQ
jgi:hypothetical protein